MLKYLLKHRKITIILLTILLVTISDVFTFRTGDITIANPVGTSTFKAANQTSYFYYQQNTTGPSYFFPVGKVFVALSNPMLMK